MINLSFKKTAMIIALILITLLLCSCTEEPSKLDQKYEEGYRAGWEQAMNQLDESGALAYLEDASNFLEERDYDETESWIDAAKNALRGVQRLKPQDYIYR